MTDEHSAVPGWYPDPEAEDGRRYWDGSAWTEHRDDGADPATPAAAEDARRKRWPWIAAAAVIVVAAAAGAVMVIAGGGDDEPAAPTFEGVELWRTDTGLTDGRASIVGHDAHTVVFAANSDCEGCDTVEIVVIDRSAGTTRWSETVDLGVRRLGLSDFPVRLHEGLLLWTEARDAERDHNDLVARDAATGVEIWRTRADVDRSGWFPWGDQELLLRRTDDGGDSVEVLDTATGAERWSLTPPGAEPTASISSVFASTVVVGTAVRSSTGDGPRLWTYTAYDRDGTEQWQVDGSFGVVAESDTSVDPDVVLIPDGDDLVGVGRADGTEQWRLPDVGSLDSEVDLLSFAASPHLVTCREADNDASTEIVVYDRGTGRERWRSTISSTGDADDIMSGSGTVAWTPEALIVSSSGVAGCGLGGLGGRDLTLRALAWDDGNEVWSRRSGTDLSTQFYQRLQTAAPTIGARPIPDILLAEIEPGRTSVLDPATGEIRARVSNAGLRAVGNTFAVVRHDLDGGLEISPYDGGAGVSVEDSFADFIGYVDGVLYVIQGDGLLVAIN